MESLEIIERIRNKDEQFIKDLYKKNKPLFVSFIMKHNGFDKKAATDKYQESFYVMYCNIMDSKLNQLTGEISSYIIGIGKNLVSNETRKKFEVSKDFFNEDYPVDDFLTVIEEEQSKITKSDLVRIALATLSDKCRSILELFYWSRLNYVDILGKVKGSSTVDVLKSQKKRCLYHLEEKLKIALKAADLF